MRHALLVLLCCGSAAANPPRYPRRQAVPTAPHPTTRARQRTGEPAPARPGVTADDILAAEERAAPIRAEQEAILIQLAHDTPDDDPEKPDILFRLAEHYAAQVRLWHVKSLDLR